MLESLKPVLKPLAEQVIVITGATSGIGLATSRLAAEAGAGVFLIARDEEGLRRACREIREKGGKAEYHVADVVDEAAIEEAARLCREKLGRIDTWVNNAGVSIYGRVLETPLDEARRLFDTNFWGVLVGCRVALPYLRANGGALINIGSVLSDVAIPLQGIYSASKHAVKGLTDALRREIMAEKAPISITLVKPGAIDTPYPEHAENLMDGEPTHTPPVYAPEVVARTVLRAAAKPVREIGVGGSAFLYTFLDRLFPRSQDLFMSKGMMESAQSRPESPGRAKHKPSLRKPGDHGGSVRGNYPGHVMKSSVATEIALRPLISGLSFFGIVSAGAFFYLRSRDRDRALDRAA